MLAFLLGLAAVVGLANVLCAVIMARASRDDWQVHLASGVVVYIFAWWAQTLFAADAFPTVLPVATTALLAVGLLAACVLGFRKAPAARLDRA